MNRHFMLTTLVLTAGVIGAARPAAAENYKSVKECVPGKRVVNNMGDKGKILRISQGTLCVVLLDTGKEQSSIFWMLRDEGASAETNDKLVPGTYACYAGNPNQYTFMDLKILSANSYEWAGARGNFHVDPSRKIVYETGPLARYTSKLLAGPSVGLNTDGGTFFGTHCDLQKK
jgi:hypothetical protein